MKKLIGILLVVIFLLSLMSISASANDERIEYGTGLVWDDS